jgi:hypothetical protein
MRALSGLSVCFASSIANLRLATSRLSAFDELRSKKYSMAARKGERRNTAKFSNVALVQGASVWFWSHLQISASS